MSDLPDLGPATHKLANLLENVTADQLTAPTPCAGYALGDLIDHISGLALGLAAAARKDFALTAAAPSGDAARLPGDWRARIPGQLADLAEAWRSPTAWQGLTQAGGINLPGALVGNVTMNELVVHGWDIAKATGQPFDVDPDSLAASLEFVAPIASGDPGPDSPFGPLIEVPADASQLDKLIGLTGRDPDWTPDHGTRKP